METCGAACVLMLVDYYGKIQHPNPEMEMMVYSHHRVNGYKGMTGAAIANCLTDPKAIPAKFLTDPDMKLDVHLVQSFREKMDNRKEYFPEDIYDMIMASHELHLQKCKDRIRFSAGKDFDLGFLEQELADGKKIVLECFIPEDPNAPPSVLHWVILEEYDAQTGLFRVRDPNPKVKLLHLTVAEVEAYMDTPIEKICITVSG